MQGEYYRAWRVSELEGGGCDDLRPVRWGPRAPRQRQHLMMNPTDAGKQARTKEDEKLKQRRTQRRVNEMRAEPAAAPSSELFPANIERAPPTCGRRFDDCTMLA